MSQKYKNDDPSQFFTTYDLNLSAVFVACGFVLEKIDKKPRGKSLFFFRKSAKLDQILQRYWRKEIELCPQVLFNAIKFIKNRLYSNY